MTLGATLGGGWVCSHYGAPLNEGTDRRRSDALSLEDGNVREGPTCTPAPSYEVRVVNDQVEVKMRA